MNSEPISRNACKQWNGRTLGVLALGVLLSGVPALAQQDQQNPPDPSNPPATRRRRLSRTKPCRRSKTSRRSKISSNKGAIRASRSRISRASQINKHRHHRTSNKTSKQRPRHRIKPGRYRRLPAPQYQQPAPPPQQYARVRPANLPDALTIPAGTVIQVRTTRTGSPAKKTKTGDVFIATLVQPIVVDGWVVMRRNQNIIGHVTDAKKAPRGGAFRNCNSI